MPLNAGDLVDRYRIVAPLGAGGMGEVYRAHDTRLQRDVALKILHPDPESGTDSATGGAARLLREARSVAALEHPNVISIHDVGEIHEPESLRGTPYIAMELIKGKSLRELMSLPQAPLVERIAWLAGAAHGLAAAHRAGLVHRDVKPENIMVRDDGVVKVLDFGIAKRSYPATSVDPTSSTEAQLLPHLSTAGLVVGTPYYMAPEQMRSEVLDGRADQFSWGVVAYELLAGKPPWRMGGDALQLVSEVLSRQPAPPSAVNPEVPQPMDAIVMRALAKDRDTRFPTMSAVAEMLGPAGGIASSRSLPPQTDPFARTESILPVSPGGSVPKPSSMPRRRSGGSAPAPRRATTLRWGLGALAAIALLGAGGMLRRRAEPGGAPAPVSPGASADARAAEDVGSSVPAAVSAYRAGLSAMRDADPERAIKELGRALEADPRFAAAHVRYALTRVPPTDDALVHLREAMRLRDSLGGHDRTLVDAFAPLIADGQDLLGVETRLSGVLDAHKDDADFTLQLCRARQQLMSASALGTCQRAHELDPGAATPLRALAFAQIQANDVRGALASFDGCLRASPLATSCLQPVAQLQAFEGDCNAELASARRLTSIDPESPLGYDALAESLAGAGETLDSVQQALDAKLARLPPEEALEDKRADSALVAIRYGDFSRANAMLKTWDDAEAPSADEADHYEVSVDRALLALEEARGSDAAALAKAYLARRAAWSSSNSGDRSMFFDGVLYRTGAISKEELVRRRTKWLAWNKETKARQPWFAWIDAYANPAVTAADAQEAIQVLPEYGSPPNPMLRAPDIELPAGLVYKLAGRDAEALQFLTRAAKACMFREAPFEPTWANLALGEIMERLGDTKGACGAYQVVASRWGTAKTSVTAREAAVRLRALGCRP